MAMASWGAWVGERGKEEAPIRPGIDVAGAGNGIVLVGAEVKGRNGQGLWYMLGPHPWILLQLQSQSGVSTWA
jgi:hypothetical protein